MFKASSQTNSHEIQRLISVQTDIGDTAIPLLAERANICLEERKMENLVFNRDKFYENMDTTFKKLYNVANLINYNNVNNVNSNVNANKLEHDRTQKQHISKSLYLDNPLIKQHQTQIQVLNNTKQNRY